MRPQSNPRRCATKEKEKVLQRSDEYQPGKTRNDEQHDVEAAEASGRKLKAIYPMLQIENYDAANKVRTLLS